MLLLIKKKIWTCEKVIFTFERILWNKILLWQKYYFGLHIYFSLERPIFTVHY